MSDYAAEEQALRIAVMRADLNLKTKQSFWETPKAILLIIATTAAIAGFLGFKIGSQPQQITVHLDAPLVLPRAAP